jgi:hypothetical protein
MRHLYPKVERVSSGVRQPMKCEYETFKLRRSAPVCHVSRYRLYLYCRHDGLNFLEACWIPGLAMALKFDKFDGEPSASMSLYEGIFDRALLVLSDEVSLSFRQVLPGTAKARGLRVERGRASERRRRGRRRRRRRRVLRASVEGEGGVH